VLIKNKEYHWVSEFAPPSIQKFLSYIIGNVFHPTCVDRGGLLGLIRLSPRDRMAVWRCGPGLPDRHNNPRPYGPQQL
jgi:hypothetical protein